MRGKKPYQKKDGKKTMPKYKYRFANGEVSEVEVSESCYALLKKLDREEQDNNRRHRRRIIPFARLCKEDEANREHDNDLKGDS